MQKINTTLILRDQTQIRTEIINESSKRLRLIDILNGDIQRTFLGFDQFITAGESLSSYYRQSIGNDARSSDDNILKKTENDWKQVPGEYILDPSFELFGVVKDEQPMQINVDKIALAYNLTSYRGTKKARERSKQSMKPMPVSITLDTGYKIDGNILVPVESNNLPSELQRGKHFIAVFEAVMYFPPAEHYYYKRYDHLLINTTHIQCFTEPPAPSSPMFIPEEPEEE